MYDCVHMHNISNLVNYLGSNLYMYNWKKWLTFNVLYTISSIKGDGISYKKRHIYTQWYKYTEWTVSYFHI